MPATIRTDPLSPAIRGALAISVIAASVFWLLQGFRPYTGSMALKLLPLLALLPLLWAHRAAEPVRWIMAALCCHMLGDAVMEWDRKRLLLAIAPFLAGHLLLAMAWWRSSAQPAAWQAPGRVLLVIFTLGMLALLLPRLQGPLQFAVPLYVSALVSMAWLALGTGQRAIAAGALSYVLSDAIIAWSALVQPLPYELYLSWPTYYLAQWAMIGGAVRAAAQKL